MVKKLSRTWLAVVIALLVVGLIALLWATGLFGTDGRKRTYSWQESYKENSSQPYGTHFLRRLMDTHFGDVEVLTSRLAKALPNDAKGTYFFVGQGFYPDSSGIERLMRFVREGNTAFIAADAIPYEIANKFYGDDCDVDGIWSDYASSEQYVVGSEFSESALASDTPFYHYKKSHTDTVGRDWMYFDFEKKCWDLDAVDQLGYYYMDKKADDPNKYLDAKGQFHWNYIRLRYGKGLIYLHTTPLAFTNYFVADSLGAGYISRSLSYLPKGQIYWDEHSHSSERTVRSHNGNPKRSDSLENGAPLKYILAQPALAWAWYILLFMAILYVVFRAKRRQKSIPFIEPNTNQTLAYITTIGRMYFLQGNSYSLVKQQQRLFLLFVRERYNLVATQPDATFQTQLSKVSGVSSELISRIFLTPDAGTDNDLVFCYQSIATFKQQCS